MTLYVKVLGQTMTMTNDAETEAVTEPTEAITVTKKKAKKATAVKKELHIADYEGSLPEVATNFLQPCKKCEEERYHKVLSHTDIIRAKVECEVCSRKTTLRLKKKKVRAKKANTRIVASGEMWGDLSKKVGTDNAVVYNMMGSFPVNSAIEHPSFGIGFVTTSWPHKIEVVFEDGVKRLVQRR